MTTSPSRSTLIKPGDVLIDEITLESYTGFKMSLRGIFDHFVIYEDIYSNCMSGEITLIESYDLVKHFPIIGAETLTISYKTPYDKTPPTVLKFRTYKVSLQLEAAQRNTQAIRIEFISPHAIKSMQTKISRSYKNRLISDIVTDIYREYLASDIDQAKFPEETRLVDIPGKPTDIELGNTDGKIPIKTVHITYDNRSYVIPYWTPLYTINWLCHRARAKTNSTHCDYVFFENSDGHHFVSLSELKTLPSSLEYTNYPIGSRNERGERPIEFEMRNVMGMTITNNSDRIKQQNLATFASTILTHDLTTKTFNSFNFEYDSTFNEVGSHLNKYRMLPQNKTDYGSSWMSVLKFYPNSTYTMAGLEKTADPSETILYRQSLLMQMNSFNVTIECWGDTNVKVGQTIDFTTPSKQSPKNTDKYEDDYVKGKYLITAIRHMVNEREHRMTMTITKDSFAEPLADFKNTELK